MEAKDITAKEVARQAEFGMEPSGEDFVIAGREAGIREVVEWVYHNASFLTSKQGQMWRAKKREWGIE